eukprot:EG_transcript_48888
MAGLRCSAFRQLLRATAVQANPITAGLGIPRMPTLSTAWCARSVATTAGGGEEDGQSKAVKEAEMFRKGAGEEVSEKAQQATERARAESQRGSETVRGAAAAAREAVQNTAEEAKAALGKAGQ